MSIYFGGAGYQKPSSCANQANSSSLSVAVQNIAHCPSRPKLSLYATPEGMMVMPVTLVPSHLIASCLDALIFCADESPRKAFNFIHSFLVGMCHPSGANSVS